ncbi:MAG: hypothetical protein ACXABY_30985 [Candidatus Thorarchaeota archaeon]|jgi:DNA-directed RNA polymerase subunit RPC12/RpoP
MYHRPVCVKCEVELRPEENGIGLLDMFNPTNTKCPICEEDTVIVKSSEEGTNYYYCKVCKRPVDPERSLRPYQIWDADLYQCPSCRFQIVVEYGNKAIAHHYDEDDKLANEIEAYESRTRVVKNY